MNHRTERIVRVCLVSILMVAAATHAAPRKKSKLPVWEEAAETYRTTMGIYTLGDYKQTRVALEDFIKRFPTNEHIPVAHLQLSHCRSATGDPKGAAKILDDVIKKFPDSRACMYAYGAKLGRLRGRKDYDGCWTCIRR